MTGRRLRMDRRGMTLVEIMAGFAILAIVVAVSLSIMLFASRVLSGDSARDRMKMLGDEMYGSLNRRLTFSTHVQLLAEGSDPAGAQYENVLFVKDGRLYQGRKEGPYSPYTGEDVYQGTALTMRAEAVKSTTLRICLSFSSGSREAPVYETASSFRLINLEAGTDPIVIESAGTGEMVNPVISYDADPYIVEEAVSSDPGGTSGTDPTRPEGGDAYTVDQYWQETDPSAIRRLEDGALYYPGDIVEAAPGEYWEVVALFYYFDGVKGTHPGQPHTNYWKCLDKDWETVNAGNSGRSLYEYHDVVEFDGAFYMSVTKNLNSWKIMKKSDVWKEVYWFPDHDPGTPNRVLGWSSDPDIYVPAVETYK